MRAHARVALVSLAMATGGLVWCGSLDKLSDTTTGWLVSPEHPPAKITPGEETSEPSAKDGASATKTADTPFEKKDKPAPKPQRPEPTAQGEPLQHAWPAAPAAGTFSR